MGLVQIKHKLDPDWPMKNTKLRQNCMELDKRTKLKIVKVEIKLKEMKLKGFN